MHKKLLIGIMLFSLLAVFSGCTSGTENTGNEEKEYTRALIQEELNTTEGIYDITWSPDNQKVIYRAEGNSENNDPDKVYLRKVGEDKANIVREISQGNYSFTWSPDSQYFLISEQQGEKISSNIFNADTLAEEKYKIESTSLPIWNPKGLSLVFANEKNYYGDSWGYMETYTIGDENSEYIWKARDTQYLPEFWDEEGNIAYTEVYKGNKTKKTTKNIKPSISGVHLGDSRDQVKAVLGEDYEETPPSGEMGHFPEQVYRWTYDQGFIVFIGETSGKVLEISATSPEAETNLGINVGDTAEKVFQTYRPQYMEPESIHGGKLYGIFKVEGAAALCFYFVMEEGETQYDRDVKPDAKVERILLTYPEHLDDSF